MLNSGEKEVHHQGRRIACCHVRRSKGVLLVMPNEIEGCKSRPRIADMD
jgi:hypothetical protein